MCRAVWQSAPVTGVERGMNSMATLERVYLIVMSLVAWTAIVLQIFLAVGVVIATGQSPLVGIVNTLSYFTVLTNLLVAMIVTASLRGGNVVSSLTRQGTQSAVCVYILAVGLIYTLLLRNVWEPTGLQLVVDVALHDAIPVLYVLYWLAFVPKGTLRWRQPLLWLLYPAAYFIYFLLRGAFTGKYLYHFLDVAKLGHWKVLVAAAVFVVVFYVLGLLVVALDQLIGRYRKQQATQIIN